VNARQPKTAAECADFADLRYEVTLMSTSGRPAKGAAGKGQWPNEQNRFGSGGPSVQYQAQGGYQGGPAANYFPPGGAGNFKH